MSKPAASGASAVVDRLEFIVLVDNSIEWMTQLPPGWSTELKVQLQNGLPRDQETGVPILDLPNFCCGAHGLSILITTERDGQRRTMLFDTGPDGRALERNIAALKVPPQQIETIVLSHWHADHTGGLLTLLDALKASSAGERSVSMPVVDVHASYPPARGILPLGTTQVLARLPADPTFDQIRETEATLQSFDGPLGHTILNDTVWVSGQIPREIAWDGGLIGSVRWNPEEKAWHPDELILDERYVAVDVLDLGLVIFSACSHAGICNVVADAQSQFPGRPVHMVVGGLHLASPELAERIPLTTEYLKDAGVEFVVPLHCTGLRAKVALGNTFGQQCVAAGTGVRAVISKS